MKKEGEGRRLQDNGRGQQGNGNGKKNGNGSGNGNSNGNGNGNGGGNGPCNGNKKRKKSGPPPLTPSKVAVIIGLISDALIVNSILVDRNQEVQIVLTGSLRRKTKLDKMLDEIGDESFDDVLAAFMRRV
ncbi:hypothetical protein [Heliomicrobium gestii]|uniref:hypothetical protein n=1 Tax=Heliomicrobium gestii TaxID=2699 RepID=UPI00195EB6FF|nr:hypothetical protein [Heliomicrobium gestii]MBM7866478.1 hypothetical protein [Heliomicrobium gestii]